MAETTDQVVTYPFTIAIVTDVHGNLDALEAVLADLQDQRLGGLVIGGDLALFGPEPAACIDRLRALDAVVIRGNTDQYIAAHREGRWADHPWTKWVRDQIGEDRRSYLESLPFDVRVSPPDLRPAPPQSELLVVHATPTSIEGDLVLERDVFGDRTVTPLAEAEAMLGNVMANLICYGHIHYSSAGEITGRRVRSVNSVGFPFDGDQRAAYALVHWDGTNWTVEDRRVAYEVEPVIEAMSRTDAPFAAQSVARLRQARGVKG